MLEEKPRRGKTREVLLTDGGISLHPISSKLMYQPQENGTVRLVWIVSIYTRDAQHYWNVSVDATTGAILKQEDLVIHDFWGGTPMATDAPKEHKQAFTASMLQPATIAAPRISAQAQLAAAATGGTYRVLDAPFETPNHGEFSLVSGKEDPGASPLGWHNDGLLSYTITRGNNVFAYEDQLGANAGTSPDGGANLIFDFPADLSQQPGTYVKAATTNLFYWNNLMHDVFYQFGFDEVSGNFQHTNFSGQGQGLDAVMAEAQDGGGTNNANFLTLQDGIPGRMQMYLWTSAQPAELLFITSPAAVAGGYMGIEAAFGKPLDETGVSGSIVLADPANGCSGAPALPAGSVVVPFTNQEQINGNIALVDRGECSFIEKALNAQASGATAVIVVNNIAGGGALSMGGDETGNLVLIPAIMISKEDGDKLKAALTQGLSGTLRREGGVPPMKDGDLDNGIIAHEYGHGISTRLTGGPSTQCLSGQEQGGEGWSDFFGLYMTMKNGDTGTQRRGIGTYVMDEGTDGNGIRPAPYSTDMGINPYTYGMISNPEISVPHGVGFIWASMLWDMTWNLIEEYGYDPDIYNGKGGNNLALQLVIDGLKLQPCSPGFIDMRDAILAADQINNGGANQCYIWRAFAKRGLGYSAQQGSSSDLTDGVEAFDMPPSCEPNMAIRLKATPSPVADGEELTYTITVSNETPASLQGVQITDPLPANTTFVSATDGGSLQKDVVKFKPVKLAEGQTIERSFTVKVASGGGTTVLFSDDMEAGAGKWTTRHDVGLADWTLSSKNPRSGTYSWFAIDPDAFSNQSLILKSPVQLPQSAQLRFWHDYNTEEGFDGGVVEITTNGGLTWQDLGPHMIQNGYNGQIPLANASTVQGPAFTGGSNGYIQTIADLSTFAGKQVQIRFRMGSDVLTGATGWFVDDVDIVVNPTYILNTAWVDSKFGGKKSASVETMVVTGAASRTTTSLTATAQDNSVLLNFSASKGAGVFELERSLNGREFETIATLTAQEAEGSPAQWTDTQVSAGSLYYYRATASNNGQIATETVQVQLPQAAIAVSLYPNPSQGKLHLHFRQAVAGAVTVEVTSTLGQQLLHRSYSAQEAEAGPILELSHLKAGMYLVIIRTDGKTSTQGLVIKP
ncbi:M36 family metallopeptidase [Cesiribacter andamanensis]|uniref:Arginyl aminopeptidase n=1 Tax=Cesiribacter andamanensis AMV16 TaxID=1279009 RepID=M7N3G6_9BACT|nr:M36 family metallopeptidase [Cesiribacter andamanensis]EMR01827.1 Arginyl aminopeptidase [Cesiribacter andamanensis AMV16]